MCLGVVLGAFFFLLAATGLLVQHRERLRLPERSVSRRWLPAGYRPQDPDTEIRADIVLTDLHSGRIFGPKGPLVVDAVTTAWLLMIASGYILAFVRRRNGKP